MQRISGSTSDPRSLSIFLILISFLIALASFLGGCAAGDGQEASGNADSTALAAADSGQAATDQGKGGFLSRFRKGKDEDEELAAIPVELATVARDDVASYLSATASLEPEKRVEVLCEASGQILTLDVEEGNWVDAGQTLATLDGEDESLLLRETEVRAQAREREFRRGEALHAEQGISKKELQDLRFRYEEAEAQRRTAEHRLAQTRILAPFSGRISERFVDPGQHLTAGSRLYRLVDSDPLLARIYLPEKQAVKIDVGQPVLIVPDTHPDLELRGAVMRVAPVVDTRTGTVKVTCRIDGSEQLLRPGSFVRVKVQTDMHHQVLVIPKRALVPEGGETYVFKAVADSVIKVGIRTGYGNGTKVEVVDGLEEGDRVVAVGTGSLKAGSRIKTLGDFEEGRALADSTPGGDNES